MKIRPERWFSKYIRSATNGRYLRPKLRRIIILVVVPIWLLGIVLVCPYIYEGVTATYTYFSIKNRDRLGYNEIPTGHEYDGLRSAIIQEYLEQSHPNDTLTSDEFKVINRVVPVPDYILDGLKKFIPPLDGYDQVKLDSAKSGIIFLLAIPIYVLIFFIAPWVVLRLIYWVKDADKLAQGE